MNNSYDSFVTIQINTALKLRYFMEFSKEGFVTIQINTALKLNIILN